MPKYPKLNKFDRQENTFSSTFLSLYTFNIFFYSLYLKSVVDNTCSKQIDSRMQALKCKHPEMLYFCIIARYMSQKHQNKLNKTTQCMYLSKHFKLTRLFCVNRNSYVFSPMDQHVSRHYFQGRSMIKHSYRNSGFHTTFQPM